MKDLLSILIIVAISLQLYSSEKILTITDRTPYNTQTSAVEKLPQDVQREILSFLTVLPIQYVQKNIRSYCRAYEIANSPIRVEYVYDDDITISNSPGELPLSKELIDTKQLQNTIFLPSIENIKKLLAAGANIHTPSMTIPIYSSTRKTPFQAVQIEQCNCNYPKTRKQYLEIFKLMNANERTNLALCPQPSYAQMVQEHKNSIRDAKNNYDYDESNPYLFKRYFIHPHRRWL